MLARRRRCTGRSSASSARLVVAVRGGRQPGPQELGPPRVSAQHVVDLGVGHRHLRSGFGIRARPDRPIDGQAIVDAADGLLDAVVRGADQIELAELGETSSIRSSRSASSICGPSDSNSSFAASSSAAK